MAIRNAQVSVTDASAALLATADIGNATVTVLIPSGLASEAYLGDANVTASNGLMLPADGTPLKVELREGDKLYAICATTESTTVHVLETE